MSSGRGEEEGKPMMPFLSTAANERTVVRFHPLSHLVYTSVEHVHCPRRNLHWLPAEHVLLPPAAQKAREDPPAAAWS